MNGRAVIVLLGVCILVAGIVLFFFVNGKEQTNGGGVLSEAEEWGTAAVAKPVGDGYGIGDLNEGSGKLSSTVQEKTKRRRLKDKRQREQFVAAILMARKLREERERSGSSGEEGEVEKEGSLSKESIQDAVAAVIEDVKMCYEDQLEITPKLGGKLVLNFVIKSEEGVGGVVDSVELDNASDKMIRKSDDLTECITDTIYTLELPEPEGGGQVKISYPFVMKPSEGSSN